MKLSDHPTAIAAFREATHTNHSGLGTIRFQCKKCRNSKPTGGSKKNTPYGWVCKECNELITGESK